MTREWRIVAASVAVAAVVGLSAFIHPVLPVGIVGVLALPLLLRPKVLVFVAAIAILLSGSLTSITQIPWISFTDEALVVALLFVTVAHQLSSRRALRRLPGAVPIILYLAWGAFSSAFQSVPFADASISAFILVKGWLFAYAVAQLDWSPRDISSAARVGGWVIVGLVTAVAVNLALGAQWTSLWNGAATYTTRFGIPALQGLLPNPLIAGNTMACAFLLVLTHGLVYGMTKRHRMLLVGTAAGVGFSGRRTAILGTAAGAILVGLRLRATATLAQVLVLTPVALVLAWSTIVEAVDAAFSDYVERGDTAARTIMHRDMVDVANTYFPFGAGFGRFGSYMAGVDYSPEYIQRGYQYVWGLSASRGNDSFLTDTQWPAVVGETGWIGTVFAICALISVLVTSLKAMASAEITERWLGSAVTAMFVVLLVASVGVPMFFGGSPPQAPFFLALGVLVAHRSASTDAARAVAPPRAASVS